MKLILLAITLTLSALFARAQFSVFAPDSLQELNTFVQRLQVDNADSILVFYCVGANAWGLVFWKCNSIAHGIAFHKDFYHGLFQSKKISKRRLENLKPFRFFAQQNSFDTTFVSEGRPSHDFLAGWVFLTDEKMNHFDEQMSNIMYNHDRYLWNTFAAFNEVYNNSSKSFLRKRARND